MRLTYSRSIIRRIAASVSMLLALVGAPSAQAPALDKTGRQRAKEMLNQVRSVVRNNYYDQSYHGLDLNKLFKDAESKIEGAMSLGHAYAIIAQALIDFDDSHTFFLPPERPASYEQGWKLAMVGDTCYVVGVKPGSDAEAKGLKAGDRVLQLEAFTPTRDQLWKAK